MAGNPLFLFFLFFLSGCTQDIHHNNIIQTDLLIVGGTESGWAAAIQAARIGVPSITIVHDGEWIGGQFTEQALACVDENKGNGLEGWGVDWHPMKRSFHRSGLFKELMDRIESHNLVKYGSAMPGKPYHGPSTFRPAEAEAIFREMLDPYIGQGQIQVYRSYIPSRVVTENHQLSQVHFKSTKNEPFLHIAPRMTIDASDWGEIIQLSGAGFDCGPDPQSRYDEPGAPVDITLHPANEMNPITWAMVVEETEQDEPTERPIAYDDRNYIRTTKLSLQEMNDLKWDRPVSLGSIEHWPDAGQASPRQLSVYNVRRIVDGYSSKDGKTSILLNYMLGQDYPLERLPKRVADSLELTEQGSSGKNIVRMTREQRDIIFNDAKRHALGVLYHLQTFVHDRAEDKTHSFRHFKLSDEFGTKDQLPPKPYIRESLRLKAMYMMREQDSRNNDGPTKNEAREAFAQVIYPDGVAAWQFHYDFHRTGRTYLTGEGTSGPWIDLEKGERHTRTVSDRSVFPLRSMIPEKVDGLIGAQKNLGYSSIVSAAIRLHDQCIHIGQAAGATAAVCLMQEIQPRQIPDDQSLIESVRHYLCGGTEGIPMLLWPYRDMSATHPGFVAVNRLAMRGLLPITRREVDFKPDSLGAWDWQAKVVKNCIASLRGNISNGETNQALIQSLSDSSDQDLTRAEFAIRIWNLIKDSPGPRWMRQSATDADADGILDQDDALPFNAVNQSWENDVLVNDPTLYRGK